MTESMLLLFTISQNHIQKFCRNVHMSFYPVGKSNKTYRLRSQVLRVQKKKKRKEKKQIYLLLFECAWGFCLDNSLVHFEMVLVSEYLSGKKNETRILKRNSVFRKT